MKKGVVIGIIWVIIAFFSGFLVGQQYHDPEMNLSLHKVIKDIGNFIGNKIGANENEKFKVVAKGLPKIPIDPVGMAGNDNYLRARWGMTQQQVSNITGASFKKTGIYLSMEVTIAGENADVVYLFVANKLWKVAIVINKEIQDYNDYIPLFNKLESMLIDKYGKEKRRIKEGGKNPNTSVGDTVTGSYGRYITLWELPETIIGLSLTGDNNRAKLVIHYESKEYKSMAEEERRRKPKVNL